MKKTIFILLTFTFALQAQLFPNLGGQRAGTAAAQFLKIGVGARAIGMGEAFTAMADDAEALYWNPAGMILAEKNRVIFSRVEWVVDVDINYGGIIWHLNDANALGLAITHLTSGDMKETTELQPLGTGRTFTFSDFLVGLSYSRRLTSQFSFGVTAKFMQESVYGLEMRSLLFDLGTYYDTGFHNIRFAMVVTNFGEDMSPEGSIEDRDLNNETVRINDFQAFPPPTVLRMGLASEVYEIENHKVSASLQLNHPNDNKENISLGLEYTLFNQFALRGGFRTGSTEENFSAGLGFFLPTAITDLKMDYALTDFGRLGFVNRFAVQFMF